MLRASSRLVTNWKGKKKSDLVLAAIIDIKPGLFELGEQKDLQVNLLLLLF